MHAYSTTMEWRATLCKLDVMPREHCVMLQLERTGWQELLAQLVCFQTAHIRCLHLDSYSSVVHSKLLHRGRHVHAQTAAQPTSSRCKDCVRSFREPAGSGAIKCAVLHRSRCQAARKPHKWVLSRIVPCSSRRTMTTGHQVVWTCCRHKIGQLPQLRRM
jgi:hypothetical protein